MVHFFQEKLKWEVNPLLLRIQTILEELQTHFVAASSSKDVKEQKDHWSVLYRVGDTLDEMATLLRNTTPVLIQTDVDYIKQALVFYTQSVIQTFGKREALFIITPRFRNYQESGIVAVAKIIWKVYE